MARDWTKAQRKAIGDSGHTLLVSAAAGSGKTAVLTERIIRSLTDPDHPADISRILVVTFTRAAAAELRERINMALSEQLAADPTNRYLNKQRMLLGSAHISTIDSFYLELVRAHFAAAGESVSFRMETTEALLPLRQELMRTTVTQMYAEHPDFIHLADIFCDFRSEDLLAESLLKIYGDLLNLPNTIESLRETAEMLEEDAPPLSTPFGISFLTHIHNFATAGITLLDETIVTLAREDATASKKYGDLLTEMRERFGALDAIDAQSDYATLQALLHPFSSKIGGGKKPELSKEFETLMDLCTDMRDKWKDLVEECGVFSANEVAQSAAETAALLRLLYATFTSFEKDYMRAKSVREVREFSDVSRAAYHLLVDGNGKPTPLACEVRDSFDAVYIDEYQDVNAMQDATFRAITTSQNRFMVGDIKQCIYRFRGACPDVFAAYKRDFPLLETANGSDAAAIPMSNCFRCDENIVKFSNAVSRYLFPRLAPAVGYTDDDDLIFSKPQSGTPGIPCHVLLIDRARGEERSEGYEGDNAEARMIAAEILRLMREEKKADGDPIEPKDIAILFRTSRPIPLFAKELEASGIPCRDETKRNFFENPEVLCVYSLLATIDNPFRDVYLAATLRSPFFDFSLSDLVTLRSEADRALSLYEAVSVAAESETTDERLRARCDAFLATLKFYREMAENVPVDRLLREIYRRTAALSLANDESAPHVQRANLRRLYEYARTFESSGYKGLYQFVRYVDELMQNGVTLPAPTGATNAVSLITIHSSKGLEYPVCFVANTAASLDGKRQPSPFLASADIGCALFLSNGAGPLSLANSFWRETLHLQEKNAGREEEVRILYVAMTRAKERLYITGNPVYGAEKPLKTAQNAALTASDYPLLHANSYLDWILLALMRVPHDDFCKINVIKETELETAAPILPLPAVTTAEEDADNDVADTLAERFSFVYPFRHLTRLPAKLSVSRLTPEVLDVFDNAPSPRDLLSPDAETLLHTFDRVPSFDQATHTPDAAVRGTATHEFLQFCDFARTEKEGVRAELARLIHERFLPPENADAVRVDELERFFESDFYRSLSTAREIHRETRFNIFLPAADFTGNETFAEQLENERLLVQGVIDLFFTDAEGRLVLCDYKTDRLTPHELRDPAAAAATLSARHKEQLSYYARALREICGRSPARILIYSLPLGEAVDVM